MRTPTYLIAIMGSFCALCGAEPKDADHPTAADFERLQNMGKVTIKTPDHWRMTVLDDGSVRLSGAIFEHLFKLDPGTCDKAALIRDLPGVPPPDGVIRTQETPIWLSIEEPAEGKRWSLIPSNSAAAFMAIRRVIGKVPAAQRDKLRSALAMVPLVSEGHSSDADSERLEKLLTPGQKMVLRDWLDGTPGILRGISSLESPELSLLFGDDTFVWLFLDMRAEPKDAAAYRTVLVHEGKRGVKAHPTSETVARFGEMLEDAGHKVRNVEDARLAAGAFAALQRVQTFGPLAVEQNADGFTVKWNLLPPEATRDFVERQARFPESVRFTCDAEGRVHKAEPKLPEPAKESGKETSEKQPQ